MSPALPAKQAKFARIWRGRAAKDKADAYERYWLDNGVAPLKARGALRVEMLREDRETDVEFITVSYWDSIEAMVGGGGADPRLAHHLERDAELLIELPERVQILRIIETRGTIGP